MRDDPRTKQDFGARCSVLFWWPIVRVLDANPNGRKLTTAPSVQRFPDGSICVGTTAEIVKLWDLLEGFRHRGLRIRQNTMFRSLRCFPSRTYQLLTTREYFDRIGGEGDFVVDPTWADNRIYPCELTAEHLRICVVFWRMPPKEILALFRGYLSEWADSVRDKGVFGEGAVAWDAGSLAFGRRQCNFICNFSGSGQNTLNWLVLSVLNFGDKHWAVSEVHCCRQEPS